MDIRNKTMESGASFAQQYPLKKGLKVFGEAGKVAASKEVDQLYKRLSFAPIDIKDLSNRERRKAQVAIMLLTKKNLTKEIKGRMVYNGKPTREWLSKEDTSSPTATLESIFLTTTIDANEGRDVMTMDIPNACIQTELHQQKREMIELL